ncbi:MAG TPA: MFS transporter [Ktedonobacterales bacterium]|nr:MFS transporter [Ktedonobacterales bacterium]
MSVREQPGEPAAAKSPADGRRTLAITCSAHFVHDGIADAFYVLLPIWAQAFGLSYVQVGTLRMAYSTAMAFLQLPAGMLAERVGERTLLAGGSMLAGVAFALLATSQSYAALGALILLAGTGSAVQHPIASTLISRAYAVASRRAALGVYNFVGDVGKMVVAAAMGLGIVAIGWRSSVVLYGLIVVGVGLLTLVALANLADGGPRTPRKAAPAPDVGWGFTNPTGFALLGAIQLIDSACRTGFLTFFPFLLIAKGASVASIGFGLSLVFVGGAAGKLVCGLIAERVGILRTVILTELATGALIAAVVLAPLGWAMLLLMPVGVALNGTSSVLYGTVAEFVRDDRQSRSYGLFYTLGSAAGATAPFVFGILSDFAGVPTALMLVAALAVTTVPIALLLGPHIDKGEGA